MQLARKLASPAPTATDALVLAHLGLEIGPGDAVFVPAFSYVATLGAVRMACATPGVL